MIAADLSNPQGVGLARRGRLGLPPASGLMAVVRIFGHHLVVTLGPSRRAPAPWVLPAGAGTLGTAASLDLECARR